jgi:hypothetical protein
MTAYCVKCRKSVWVDSFSTVSWPNKRSAYHGACPTCGTKVYRILKAA